MSNPSLTCPDIPLNPYSPRMSYRIPSPTPGNSVPPYARVNYLNFDSRNIAFEKTGSDVNALVSTSLNLTQYMAGLQFDHTVGVVALELATSMINDQAAGLAGLFVMRYQGDNININQSKDCFIAHLTYQNSTAGSPNPTNRTNSLSFGATSALKFQTGERMAVYACSPNAATVLFAVTLAVYIVPIAS